MKPGAKVRLKGKRRIYFVRMTRVNSRGRQIMLAHSVLSDTWFNAEDFECL
jgi:hypothetical protein